MVLIEPGLLRVFRYFTTTAMAYFAAIVIFGQAQSFLGQPSEELAVQFYLNLWIYAILLAYLSVSWFRVRLGKTYLPLAIVFSTIGPVFTNLIYLVDADTTDLLSLISQSWLLFPILLIPLVITAWQYPMRYSVVFSFSVVVVELIVLLPFVNGIHLRTLPILGVPIIQGFAFGLVGSIVNQIMEEQRSQKRKVIQANVQLSEQAEMLEKMATVRERNRLGRELHDTLAHTLSGLSVHLEGIKIGLNDDQEELREMIDHALENTRNGLDETRRTLKALRPRALDDLGLKLSIVNLAQEAAQRGSFDLNTDGLGDFPPLTKRQEQAIYRIVQEAFQNIIRHSNARYVTFTSRQEAGKFSIRLVDDGSGFVPEVVRHSDEFGIDGMRERAELSKGRLDISSTPEEGTAVILTYEVRDGLKVLICDDQFIVCEGLEKILSSDPEIEVVGTANNGEEALDITARTNPDVVLMDLKMPIMNGVVATRKIKELYPEIRVIILTTYDDDEWVFDAIRSGASGYLLKDLPPADLIKAIKETDQGKSFVDPAITHKLLSKVTEQSSPQSPPTNFKLTEREIDILTLITRGYSNADIAEALFLSEGTIRNYVSDLLRTLDVSDRTQAAVVAIKYGLVDISST